MSRITADSKQQRLKMGLASFALSIFIMGCGGTFTAVANKAASAAADSSVSTTPGQAPNLIPYQTPSSLSGLYLGLSFKNLSLSDFQRLYTVGSTASSGWCDVVGHDTVYNITSPVYPAALWGGTASHPDSMQFIQETKGDYSRQIVTDNTVPSGVSNRVFQLTAINPYVPNVGGISGDTQQDNFIVWPDTSRAQGMLYISKWMWLQPDMASRGPFTFFLAAESKTDITERFGAGITERSYTGFGNTPVWNVAHDGFPSGGYQVYAQSFLSPTSSGHMGRGQTYAAPVPLGQWFRLELAWNRNVGGNGWMWMALTVPDSSDPNLRKGVQIFADSGAFNFNYNGSDPQTQGWNAYNSDRINRIFPFGLYSDLARSPSSPFVEKTTNVEIWNTWPSNATAHPSNFR